MITMEAATDAMAADYLVTPEAVEEAFIGYILAQLDLRKSKDTTLHELASNLMVSALCTKKSIEKAQSQAVH